jgi:hypothetical protein
MVPTDFTIVDAREVIRKTGDAWKDILDQKQDLLKILAFYGESLTAR